MHDDIVLSRDLVAQSDAILDKDGRDHFVAEAVQRHLRRWLLGSQRSGPRRPAFPGETG